MSDTKPLAKSFVNLSRRTASWVEESRPWRHNLYCDEHVREHCRIAALAETKEFAP